MMNVLRYIFPVYVIEWMGVAFVYASIWKAPLLHALGWSKHDGCDFWSEGTRICYMRICISGAPSCICIYACTLVPMHKHMHACAKAHTIVICIYTYAHENVCEWMLLRAYSNKPTHTHEHTHIYMYACSACRLKRMYVHIDVHTAARSHLWTRASIYIGTYPHMLIFAYTILHFRRNACKTHKHARLYARALRCMYAYMWVRMYIHTQ